MAKILDSSPEPNAKPAPPAQETFSLISNDKLLAIYAAMIKCRMLEQRTTLLFQQGKLDSDLHASSGREAASAAVAIDLQPNDTLSLAPGDWLPAFVKGVTLDNLFRALAPASSQLNGGQVRGPVDLQPKNVFAGDEPHLPETVRNRAIEALNAKQGAIVAAILPSSEKSLKPWHKVMTTAASQKLPIVFVHYAEAQSETAQPHGKRKPKNPEALFHGVPAIAVDVSDAVAVYRVAYEAIVRARQRRGATLIQCASYSALFPPAAKNTGSNSAIHSISTDQLVSMETYLAKKGIESNEHGHEVITAFNRDLELATRFLDR